MGIKVMVVDDSNTIRRSAEIFLAQSGCKIILATDSHQACTLIKRNPKFKSVPAIMSSSKSGLIDHARGKMVGSGESLTKPFTKEALLDTVRKHAPQRHARV